MKFMYESVEIRKTGRLPHWDVPSGLYFATFRLKDSIPLSLLQPLIRKRDLKLREAELIVPRETALRMIEDAKLEFQRAVDVLLDRNYGRCVLGQPQAAKIMVDSMKHFDGDRYDLFTWSVLPNHAHAVFSVLTATIAQVMHTWKRYAAREINKLFGWRGSLFQPDYFDVTVRDTQHFSNCVNYVLRNPIKAGCSDAFTGFSHGAWERTGAPVIVTNSLRRR